MIVSLFFEILLQFIVEVLGQIVVQLLVESGIKGVSNALGFETPKKAYFAVIGYILLAFVPILAGILMSARGRFLIKKQKEPIRIDSFVYGYLFALTFTLVRFYCGH